MHNLNLRNILLLLSLSCMHPEIAIAQARTTQEIGLNGAVFSGIIHGGQSGKDSLRIFFVDNLITVYKSGMTSPTKRSFFVRTDEKGQFSFRLPYAINEVGAISFQLFGNKKNLGSRIVQLTDPVYPYYYVENSDSIRMNINITGEETAIRFSGMGSKKYSLADNLVKVKKLNLFEEIDHESKTNFEDNLNKVINSSHVFKALASDLLDYYKHDISSDAYQLIKADIFYNIDKYLLGQFSQFYFANNKIKVKTAYTQYLSSIEPFLKELAPLSIEYVSYIFERTIFDLRIKHNQYNYNGTELYKALKNKYDGVLRDKLITYYLCSKWARNGSEVNKGEYNNLLNDAYNLIQYQELKDILAANIQKYSKGSLAYNFALPDLNGDIVKLQDFKNKVVLLHIYSTICSGCRIFAKTLKDEVLPEFRNNPNVVFVAISIEENRDRWLKNVQEGHNASQKYEVNLYTDGKGRDHPYIKYYNINSVPTIFLIGKDSKVYNSSANTLKSGTTGKEIIAMIHDALNRN